MRFLQDLEIFKSPLNPVTLSFNDRILNRIYTSDHVKKALVVSRLSLMLGIVIFILFSFLDEHIMTEDNAAAIMNLRIIIITMFLGTIALSYNRKVKRYYQTLMVTILILGGGILILMIMASEPSGGNFYYASIILATIYAHSLLRLRFIVATIATWSVIIAYLIVAAFVIDTSRGVLLNNTLFLISANFLGMFASYGIEYYMRMSFWRNYMLQEKSRLLETEYKRKSKELEDARLLQLSMIPKDFPSHPVYDISFIMKPATEIGGDFYDLIQHDDGTITFAVGDATGHGAKAGAMVTAMKILFSSYAEKMDIVDFMIKADRILKNLRLPHLYMSFSIGRLQGDRLEITGVGMPAVTMYSDEEKKMCKLSLKGFPLGSRTDFRYKKKSLILQENDVLLIMTDGLPELFNKEKETLGYEAVEKEFQNSADNSSGEIITRLLQKSEEWMGEYPQQDDITLFVIKRKALKEEKVISIPVNGDDHSGRNVAGNDLIMNKQTR
jgi:hypothetical protein